MIKTVTFLTDFGLEDSYVSEVKAVLIRETKNVTIMDISHYVPTYDVEWGAFQLLRSYHFFPNSTCHLAVVDPEVGTDRKGLYIKVGGHHFVGPDNGVLLWAVQDIEKKTGDEVKVFEIVPQGNLFSTFHGRDFFAPFINSLLRGNLFTKKRIKRYDGKLSGRSFPVARLVSGRWHGEIIARDRFGNVVTSIPTEDFKSGEAEFAHRRLRCRSSANYKEIKTGQVALIKGSHGFWEIASNKASAWDFLKTTKGEKLVISPSE